MARWERVTAVSIEQGVIQLIEPNGEIGWYRQRGITGRLTQHQIAIAVNAKILHPRVFELPELPKNYSISFEDEEIQGKACATFDTTELDKVVKEQERRRDEMLHMGGSYLL